MSILAPLFLLGLLGAFLPWVLHRLQQQQAPQTDFPSDRFLKSTRSNSARRRKLRFKGLLLLRILALAVLCLLFAQPLWKTNTTFDDEADALQLLVIDRSFSMQYADRWQRALEQAQDIVNELPAGTSLQLFTAAARLEEQTRSQGSASDNIEAVKQALPSLVPDSSRLEFASMVQKLDEIAAQQEVPVQVTFITDAQENATPVSFGALRVQNLAGIEIISVARPDDRNVSVQAEVVFASQAAASGTEPGISEQSTSSVGQSTSATANSSTARDSAEAVTVTVKVKQSDNAASVSDSSTSQAQPQTTALQVVLNSGANELGRQAVELSGNETQTLRFENLAWPRQGLAEDFELDVVLEQQGKPYVDGLAADNRVQLAIAAGAASQVYLVSEDPVEQERDLIYAETALTEISNLLVSELADSRSPVPGNADIVILFSSRGSAELPPGVSQYLRSGGNVLQVTDALSALQTSAAQLTAQASTQASTQASVSQVTTDSVTRVNSTHPLMLDAAGWAEVSIYRSPVDNAAAQIDSSSIKSSALELADQALGGKEGKSVSAKVERADVLLASNQGLPVLFEVRGFEGSLLMLGIPLDGSSNDLPLSPVFVPFVRNLVDYFLNRNAYPATVHIGSTLNLPASVQLLSPSDEPLLELSASAGRQTRQLDEIGIYSVLDRAGKSLVSVITDPAESDMVSAGQPLIDAWQANTGGARQDVSDAAGSDSGQSVAEQNTREENSGAAKLQEDTRMIELWRWLLPALVLLGLAELLFSNWYLNRFRTGV